MDAKEQQRRFLKLGHSIARQAVALAPQERQAFIRDEIAELREMCEPIHKVAPTSAGKRLIDSMEEWVMQMVEVLAESDGPVRRA